jgi:hypothetical protein
VSGAGKGREVDGIAAATASRVAIARAPLTEPVPEVSPHKP